MADKLQGAARQDMLRLCDDCERLTNQLADLCRKGMVRSVPSTHVLPNYSADRDVTVCDLQGNSPQARAIAAQLNDKLQQLKNRMQDALVQQVCACVMRYCDIK